MINSIFLGDSIQRAEEIFNGVWPRVLAIVAAVVVLVCLMIVLAAVVIRIVANIRIFTKAGERWWKALIPGYNMYVMADIVYGRKFAWVFVFGLVEQLNPFYTAITAYNMGLAFGRGVVFCLLSVFFPTVTRLILAFGKDEYKKPVWGDK